MYINHICDRCTLCTSNIHGKHTYDSRIHTRAHTWTHMRENNHRFFFPREILWSVLAYWKTNHSVQKKESLTYSEPPRPQQSDYERNRRQCVDYRKLCCKNRSTVISGLLSLQVRSADGELSGCDGFTLLNYCFETRHKDYVLNTFTYFT